MKEFLIVTFTPPNKIGNIVLKAFSKKGAYDCIKATQDKSILVINITEL